jgi:hypothetical protein
LHFACAGLAALLLSGATAPTFAQEQTPSASAEVQLAQRFTLLQTELDRLKTAGDKNAADALAAELTRARNLFEGEFKVQSADVPELHAVGVHKGGTAPAGILKGNERYTRGYAEISVTHTAAPLILCASAVDRLHLQFKLAPGVRIAAVIRGGQHTPTVGGLPEGTLVLNRANDGPNPLGVWPMSWGDGGYRHADQILREYTGKDLLTVVATNWEAPRTPLVIGPENKTWRAQYLIAQTEGAHRRAADVARALKLKQFADLRFRALYYYSQRDGLHGDGAAAEGEFTIAGPLIDSLKPIDKVIRHLVHEPNSGTDFAIDHWTQLIVVDPKANEHPKVPLDKGFLRELRLNTLAFDTKRNRLVLTGRDGPHGVYAYNLKDATWKVLAEKGPNLGALTYVPEKDEFWGVTVSDNFGGRQGAGFCRLNADGKVDAEFRPPQEITNTFGDFGGTTLVVADNMLIVVTPPNVSWANREGPQNDKPISRIYVVDRITQEVIYSGPAVSHDGKTAPNFSQLPPAPSGKGLLHRLFDRFELADERVKKLREQGEAVRADELASQVQRQGDRLRGKLVVDDKARPQLHLVGIHEANSNTVEVAPQPHPMILVLSSYNRSSWTIRAAAGVKIERIIVGGYHQQTVVESPQGVPVETYSHDERTGGFHTYGPETGGHAQAIEQIKELTGLEPATFQGAYQVKHQPVVIGDKNSAWLVQSVAAELDTLLRDAVNERHAQRRKELSGLTFSAMYRTAKAPADRRNIPFPREQRFQFGQFTIRGPLPQTLVELPERMEQVAVDPQSGDWYARRGSELQHINPKTGESTQLPWDAALPELNHPAMIAFDSLRRLLLVLSSGGEYLYAYDVGEKKWSVISRPGLRNIAIIYSPNEDCLYGVNQDYGGEGRTVTSLRRFNCNGALLASYPVPMASAHRSLPGRPSGIDLAYLDGRIAVLAMGIADPLDRALLIPQIYVFDPQTGDFPYHGLLRPHPGVADLSAERLGELWQLLADPDEKKADQALWEMAAGQAASVEYIASHLPPIPKVDEAEVKKAIADLDSDDFKTRANAQDKLALWGGLIAPLLEANAKNPSAEVRATIRRLLAAIEQNAPASPELAREVRAVKVLEHVGNPEAVKLLEQVAADTPGAERTRAAKSALDRLAKSAAAASAAQ